MALLLLRIAAAAAATGPKWHRFADTNVSYAYVASRGSWDEGLAPLWPPVYPAASSTLVTRRPAPPQSQKKGADCRAVPPVTPL